DEVDVVFDEAEAMAAGDLWLVSGQEARPGREIVAPVRRLVTTFADVGALDLVRNGSFEDEGGTSAEAEHWAFEGEGGGGQRVLLDPVLNAALPDYPDRFAAQVYGYGPTEDR